MTKIIVEKPWAQNADGTPHFCYFIREAQLSFIWDGEAPYIAVSIGGYGEQVIEHIMVLPPAPTTPAACLSWFQETCDQWATDTRWFIVIEREPLAGGLPMDSMVVGPYTNAFQADQELHSDSGIVYSLLTIDAKADGYVVDEVYMTTQPRTGIRIEPAKGD